MFCCRCGARLSRDSRFCGGCGTMASPEPGAAAPDTQPAAAPYPDLLQNRYPGEEFALRLAVGGLALLAFLAFGISAGVAIAAALGGLLYLKVRQMLLLSAAAPVTSSNFAGVYEQLRKACERLGVRVPEARVVRSPHRQAFTIRSAARYSVVLSSGLVETLDPEELLFVLGREAGHIRAGHSRWLSLIAPLGRTLSGFDFLFGRWQRKAECTADRAGLLACRGIDAAVRALLKFSNGPSHAGVAQVLTQLHTADFSSLGRLGAMLGTPPPLTRRIGDLIAFDRAHRITPVPDPADAVRFGHCPLCGKAIAERAHSFCSMCGARLPEVTGIPVAASEPEAGETARQRPGVAVR